MTDQADEVEALRAKIDALEDEVAELREMIDGAHMLTGEEKALLRFLKEVDPLMLRCAAIERRLDAAGL